MKAAALPARAQALRAPAAPAPAAQVAAVPAPFASLSGVPAVARLQGLPAYLPVTIRQDAWSHRVAQAHHARAFALGHVIGLRAGEDSGPGSALLRHEMMHVLQQAFGDPRGPDALERDAVAGRASAAPLGQPRRMFLRSGERATRVVITGSAIVVTTDAARDNVVRTIITVFSPMQAGTYSGHFDGRGFVVQGHPGSLVFSIPETTDASRRVVAALRATSSAAPAMVEVRASTTGPGPGGGTGTGGGFRARQRRTVPVRSDATQIDALRSSGALTEPNATALRTQVASGQALTPAQQRALLDAIGRGLMATAPAGVTPTGSPAEMADFLLRNQTLQPGRTGSSGSSLTLSEIQAILDTYAQSTQGGAQALAQPRLEAGAVASDPRFAALTSAERDIWRQYLQLHPADATTSDGGPVELTPDQYFRMALRMSVSSMPAGIAGSLEQILTSPVFWASIFVSILIYLALWLAPEPVISKSVALAITLALLAVFTATEIIHLARAWSALQEGCTRIGSFADLEATAARFGYAVGETGGRILIQLALLLAGGALPRPTAPPPGGFNPPMAMGTVGGPQLSAAAATTTAIRITATGEVVVATAATLPGTYVMMSSASGGGGSSGGGPTGGRPPAEEPAPSGTTPSQVPEVTTTPPGRAAAGPTQAAATGTAATRTAPQLATGSDRRLQRLIEAIFSRATGGRFNRAGSYHGDTRHAFPDARVAEILAEPEAIYLSGGRAGRLIYRQGGDIVVVEGPGSGGGNAITAYGPSGVRGTSGATALGGNPTDPGLTVSETMITTGTIPTGPGTAPVSPAVKIWPTPTTP
jgi:hypothetical protein